MPTEGSRNSSKRPEGGEAQAEDAPAPFNSLCGTIRTAVNRLESRKVRYDDIKLENLPRGIFLSQALRKGVVSWVIAARFFYYLSLRNQREFIKGKADLAENDHTYNSSVIEEETQ